MHRVLNRILVGIACAVVTLDAIWLVAGHFEIDAHRYVLLAVLVLPLLGAGHYYHRYRNEKAIGATLTASAFLLVFSAAGSLLSYLLLTITGPRIDLQLALVDRAMGFSWPAMMGLVSHYPLVNETLRLSYLSVMPQLALLLLLLALNAVVLVAIPVHGGHHLIDMVGGAAVTVFAVAMARAAITWAGQFDGEGVLAPASLGKGALAPQAASVDAR